MPDPNKGGFGGDHGSPANKPPGDLGNKPGTGKGDLGSGLSSAADQLAQKAQDAKKSASELTSQVGRSASSAAQSASQTAASGAASVKDQAAGVANEARSTVSAMAEEARNRLTEIVDQQKAAGADTVAGVARAAKTAAGDLQQTSPQIARLVRTAAEGVDRVAGDIRSSDLNQIIATLSQFGRRQPVAFFGGAVLAGFVLARFLKSDKPERTSMASPAGPRRI